MCTTDEVSFTIAERQPDVTLAVFLLRLVLLKDKFCFHLFKMRTNLSTMIPLQADSSALMELFIGGVFYVTGVLFFKSDGRLPFAHAIWHLFCGTGAWCHFYAVYAHLY